ncbi:MAG: CocE/NonD family hydrolase [Candidatus Dormibacteraeota bacterium]|nr:CocE/NonD family hydrolase [Candidatus Dormibacteraeota bacterium]
MIDDGVEVKFLPGVPPQEGGCPALSPRTVRADGMVIDYDTAVTMRDGVEIYVDVFRPDGDEAVAPIIAWGPYGKHGAVKYDIFPKHGVDPAWTSSYAGFEAPDPLYWTRHGYAVINADPRGLWNSQGDATFYSSQEARDVYDLIEWAGTQPWSNGKVGMSGVSYLAISQWRAAAEQPPHLAAINPWEGVSDRYRDMSYHGGIPEDSFGPMWRSRRVPYSTGMVEDTVAMQADHPLFDEYWEGKAPDLSRVEVPAFVVASWSDQGLHTRGTLEGFKRISSQHKWLLVHGRKKWQFYYRPDNVELLRQFFDRFLRGLDSGVDSWPRVRLEVRERFCVGDTREERDWPLTTAIPRALHLDAQSGKLVDSTTVEESEARYVAGGSEHAEFTHRFSGTTDVVGPMALRLWVEAEGSNDMDLFVAIQKLDDNGQIVPFSFLNALEDGPVALGWLRVSHRALVAERSTPLQPWHGHQREEPLSPGEIVPVDIEIWPSGTRFFAGEQVRLVVQGSDIYTYPAGTVHMGHSKTRNAGTHVIHTGGRYDSRLLVPVVPG